MDTSKIRKLTQHFNLITKLHQIIRDAASHDSSKIEQLYEVMHKHGLIGKNDVTYTNKLLVKNQSKLLKKIKKVFRSEEHSVKTRHTHTTNVVTRTND